MVIAWKDSHRFVLLFTRTAVCQPRKCESAPPCDDCVRSLTDDNGDVCPKQTPIKTHTRTQHTRAHRAFWVNTHTHSRTHTRERSLARAYTHIHTHTHAHKDTHRHSYTIIFIYRMKCLTFYSIQIWKTYTNCVCEFKKPKVFLKIIIFKR